MADRPHHAIMRISKIHNYKVLKAVDGHNTRKIPAGTVDGAPTPIDWIDLPGTMCERAQRVLQKKGAVWEKGKILAVEVLVTASPEWWANASTEQKTEWLKAQWKFANDKFGDGLISFTPHLDESTPHVQFVGLPLYSAIMKTKGRKPSTPEGIARRAKEEAQAPKVWRLSFHEMFGGHRDRLADLQTEYHGYVAHLGLERGQDTRGLEIRHTTLKVYKLKLQKEERELFRRQRELDAEAARLAEERQALEFYNQQLAEGFGKLEAAKQEFHNAQLEHFAQTEEFRVREEAFKKREADLARRQIVHESSVIGLENRKAKLEKREVAAATRDAEAAQRAAQIESREQELAGIAAQQEAEKERLNGENQAALTRAAQLDQKEASITARERDVQTSIAQIKVFGRVLTGKLDAGWDAAVGKPKIADALLSEEERPAMAAPLPGWLAIAMRHAIRIREQRNAIAKRVQRRRDAAVTAATEKVADLERIKSELSSEQAALKAIEADKAALEAERRTLKMDAERLRKEKTELEAEKAKLQSERDDFKQRNNALYQSVALLDTVIKSDHHARVADSRLEIFPSSLPEGEPKIVELRGAPEWVFRMFQLRQKALDTGKALDAAEQRLQDRYLELEKLFPAKAPEFQKACDQDKAIVDAAFAALAGQSNGGISG
ncbi:plasmid recombination protein [Erythrobacter donghaensis]|uniref:plasmid recombination protein n=1 Tax=Erythrobacter donghaensis TaxID=267135 RepID=UPI00093C5055|nr:plasmid recombination protein [Erythrobacter donghaensis]